MTRAAVAGAIRGVTSTPRIAALIVVRDGRACGYCGATENDEELTVDHVVPRAVFDRGLGTGDPDSPSNLVTACGHCNSLKRDMTARVFAMYLVDSHGWTEEDADDLLTRVKSATARRLPR